MACSKFTVAPLLALLCLLSLASAAPKTDYFVLSLVWPGTRCSDLRLGRCCEPWLYMPKKDFLIDAFQPYSTDSTAPIANCSSSCTFKGTELGRDVEEAMYDYWPKVSCPCSVSGNYKQLKSVWCTTGQCSGLSLHDYFKRAFDRRSSADPLFILQEFDIVPSSNTTYKLGDIEDALRPSLGFSFTLECVHELRSTRSLLYKINICVSADGKRFITCPISLDSNCKTNVKFPPFSDDLMESCGRLNLDQTL